MGLTVNGQATTDIGVNKDNDGHLEVAVHSPRLPFGAVHTENLTPVFQSDGVYGINGGQELTNVTGTPAYVTGSINTREDQ